MTFLFVLMLELYHCYVPKVYIANYGMLLDVLLQLIWKGQIQEQTSPSFRAKVGKILVVLY